MNSRHLPLALLGVLLVAPMVSAQNPVYRHNRTFYTSMWTTNPPEYTTAGQVVPTGAMHWRSFVEQSNQRGEPHRINGIGTWWQPSDPTGTFPQNIPSPEFRIYPNTINSGLVEPDFAQTPLLTVPPVTIPVQSYNAFNSVTISLGSAVAINTNDFAICGVYPANASSTSPGFFGFLPSASNQTYGIVQSFYGFYYPSTGTLTHFGLGGARSSIWYNEEQPILSLRGNWAISDAHNSGGYLSGAYGDASYFGPYADPAWAGWNDTRNPMTLGLTVQAAGLDGMQPIMLFNAGPRFPGSFPYLGVILDVLPVDPLLTLLAGIGQPITNSRFSVNLPLATTPNPNAVGVYIGFEAVVLDPLTLQLVDSTGSAWIRM
ncbi:MAG: hypothetical protein IPM29_06865 [Planctomycetes bacterium]|nr:hypothetical protein [Planctomycetota bacterium]